MLYEWLLKELDNCFPEAPLPQGRLTKEADALTSWDGGTVAVEST